jgi:HEAT repeat protein
MQIVPALVQAMEDQNRVVRRATARALGSVGPQAVEAVPDLIQALEDRTWSVRRAAAGALKAITGQDFGEDLAR